jgi:hypothetical protein
MAKKKWKHVRDSDIKHLWGCNDSRDEGCEAEAEVSPDWYEQNGTPVCPECDRDMGYIKTVVRL